jgi:predicted MFS family arabinose efflux permease
VLALALPAMHHAVFGDSGAMAAIALSVVLTGAASSVSVVALNNLSGRVSNDATRSRVFAIMSMTMSAAQFGGPPLAGLAIDYLGFTATFLLLAASPAFAAAIAWFLPARIPHGGLAARPGTRRMWDLVTAPAMRPLFVVTLLLPVGWDLFFFVIPLHGSRLGLTATTIGSVYACMSMAVFTIRAAVPWLTACFGEWRLVAIALGTAAVVFGLLPFTGFAWQMVVLALLLGAGMGLSHPVMLSLTYSSSPPGRQGEAMGVRNTILNAMQLAVPGALGALTAALSIGFAVWPFALLLAAGSRYAWTRPMPRTDVGA